MEAGVFAQQTRNGSERLPCPGTPQGPGHFKKSIQQCFPHGTSSKEPACQCRKHERCGFNPWVRNPLEEDMATHSSAFAWRIP